MHAETRANLWVVEDDDSIALCLKILLEDHGYDVSVAGSLADARRLSIAPDLVLLDFLLPDGNGIAFLPELAGRFPQLHVILLTAQDRVGESRFPNHVAYLPKPFHNKELLGLVERELERSRLRAATL